MIFVIQRMFDIDISSLIYIYIYIYQYIKWTVFVNVTTKSAQHAHARMIAIIVEKSPNWRHMYDHGFMDKWLPPWRKGRISCLWIKSVFDCLTIGIIHETMVVHMSWVWTFFNNYIYIIYMNIYINRCKMNCLFNSLLWLLTKEHKAP